MITSVEKVDLVVNSAYVLDREIAWGDRLKYIEKIICTDNLAVKQRIN
ncbi:hypothetical protein [Microcystis aeruginosa]|nr:hypothetical protein [Microcystis aeruginosa]MDB9411461.1 hypothetical protein [Microcystis aeruginosa CS-567/02]MDB9434193.1 hypothetical protein [Microcystis aeruginosa CS-552/01]